MKIRKKIGNLGKDKLQQIVEAFISDLEQGAVAVLEYFEEVENPEFLELELDDEEKIISFTRKDGSHYIYNLSSETIDALKGMIDDINESTGITTFETIDDPEDRLHIGKDAEDKIFNYRKKDGTLVENVGIETPDITAENISAKEVNIEGGEATLEKATLNSLELTNEGMTEFQQALKDSGFRPGGAGDYTDKASMEIPMPRCAYVNITAPEGDAVWPTSKAGRANYRKGVNADLQYFMEFYDGAGNYFKKEIIFSAQGNSSMGFVKKNGAADFCNNNGWDDDDTFSIKIGDWVSQDSFHFKAYYTEYLRGSSVIAYDLANDVYKTRGFYSDRPWKKALIDFSKILSTAPAGLSANGTSDVDLQIDNGARCMPDGFPTIFYLNGEFYGIYSWQLKKHRDNYHMKKDVAEHIHLDGELGSAEIFNGTIAWTGFEIRNPKNLVYKTAKNTYDNITQEITGKTYKYDADLYSPTRNDYGLDEIAGIEDNTVYLGDWHSGSYGVDKIVLHNGHYFLNTIEGNTAEPIYHSKNNSDSSPDFKNKTGCGWLNVTNTIKVKKSIIDLSQRTRQVNSLGVVQRPDDEQSITIGSYSRVYDIEKNYGKGAWVNGGDGRYYMSLHTTNTGNALSNTEYWLDITENIEVIRNTFEQYFDIENIVDYQLINMACGDSDGFRKNWQWITYDGIKWYVNQYDKDVCLGNHWSGMFTMAPKTGWINSNQQQPNGLAIKYYQDLYKIRWTELVDAGIFEDKHIKEKIKDWVNRIGRDNFKKEWDKWIESPCNRDSNIDFDNWMFVDFLYSIPQENLWDASINYNIDDICYIVATEIGYALKFKAVSANINKYPILDTYSVYPKLMGYRDSVWRFYKYIEETLENQNLFINNL